MRVSSIGLSPNFSASTVQNNENKQSKKHLNPVTTTGYMALGFFGASMITGIEKSMKLHRATCYLALASSVAHVASLGMHKHHKPENVG